MKTKSKLFNTFMNFAKIKGIKVMDSIEGKEDKINEALNLVLKPDTDFEGGNDEKLVKLLEIAESIPFDSSDFENLSNDIDKKAEFDNLLQIASSDAEDKLQKAYETLAKLVYNGSQATDSDSDSNDTTKATDDDSTNEIAKMFESLQNELKTLNDRISNLENNKTQDSDSNDDDSQKANDDDSNAETKKAQDDDLETIKEALKDEIKDEILEEETEFAKAYDSVRKVVGDFTPINANGKRKSKQELYEYGLKVLQTKYDVNIGKVQDSKSAFIACSKFVDSMKNSTIQSKNDENIVSIENIKIPGKVIKERS